MGRARDLFISSDLYCHSSVAAGASGSGSESNCKDVLILVIKFWAFRGWVWV